MKVRIEYTVTVSMLIKTIIEMLDYNYNLNILREQKRDQGQKDLIITDKKIMDRLRSSLETCGSSYYDSWGYEDSVDPELMKDHEDQARAIFLLYWKLAEKE